LRFHLPIFYDALYSEEEKLKYLSLKGILLQREHRAATGIGIGFTLRGHYAATGIGIQSAAARNQVI
jgi:hypothetical protein